MANPFDPALYLYLQSPVGVSDAAGYTRLLGKADNQKQYVEFSNAAIEGGFDVPAPNTTANLPVDANIRLYFNDPQYGPPPPPPKLPVIPVHVPIHPPAQVQRGPLGPPILPPGVYLASDGTPLEVQKARNGQITGFQATGKDGHFYSLTTGVVTEKAPGRQKNVDVLWLKASLTITVDKKDNLALVFAFRFAPTANLFQLLLQQINASTGFLAGASTGISVDYSGAVVANGTAQLTRTLSYFENSFMAQGLQIPASQQDPGMYLAAGCTFWPMIEWVEFFGPALQKMAEESTAVVAAPLAAVGSVNFTNNGVPAQYPLATYLSQAEKTVGPALGPLAASFVDTTLPFAPLAPAANWLGLLANTGTGQQALIEEFEAAYQNWLDFIAASSAPGQKKLPIDPFKPEAGDDND
jgi:hypothetical protein